MASKKSPPTTRKNKRTSDKIQPVDDDDEYVDLVVGGWPHRTTRAVLLSSPFNHGDENYFHALLSGRWKRTKRSQPIKIPDLDGRLFIYVLVFLQVGELPRGLDSTAYKTLLSKEDIEGLQLQADFFGLTRLVDLCKKSKMVLKGLPAPGDIDLTPFSNFSVEKELDEDDYYFCLIMKYTYGGTIDVSVSLEERYDASVWVGTKHDGNNETQIVNNKNFAKTFSNLVFLVTEAHGKKASEKKTISVARILDRVDIAPELRLWYAFVVQNMIEYYEVCGDLIFEDPNYDNGAVEFLMSSSVKTSLNFYYMKSVK